MFWFLVDCAAKVTMLLGVAFLLLVMMRRKSAAARHVVVVGAMVGAVMLPVVSVMVPAWRVLPSWWVGGEEKRVEASAGEKFVAPIFAREMMPVAAGPVVERPVDPQVEGPVISAAPRNETMAAAPVGAVALPVVVEERVSYREWVVAVYFVGVMVVMGPVVFAGWQLRRMRRGARVADAGLVGMLGELRGEMGIGRRVELMQAEGRAMPMTWGIFRARILLPGSASGWGRERQRLVLLHELAHVRRRDCLTLLLGRLACAMYWFHPLMWVAAGRVRGLAEQACDDLVLTAGTRSSEYAAELMAIANGFKTYPALGAAALTMARPSTMAVRLRNILDAGHKRGAITRIVVGVVLVGTVAVVLPMGAMRGGSAAAPAVGTTVAATKPAEVEDVDVAALMTVLKRTMVARVTHERGVPKLPRFAPAPAGEGDRFVIASGNGVEELELPEVMWVWIMAEGYAGPEPIAVGWPAKVVEVEKWNGRRVFVEGNRESDLGKKVMERLAATGGPLCATIVVTHGVKDGLAFEVVNRSDRAVKICEPLLSGMSVDQGWNVFDCNLSPVQMWDSPTIGQMKDRVVTIEPGRTRAWPMRMPEVLGTDAKVDADYAIGAVDAKDIGVAALWVVAPTVRARMDAGGKITVMPWKPVALTAQEQEKSGQLARIAAAWITQFAEKMGPERSPGTEVEKYVTKGADGAIAEVTCRFVLSLEHEDPQMGADPGAPIRVLVRATRAGEWNGLADAETMDPIKWDGKKLPRGYRVPGCDWVLRAEVNYGVAKSVQDAIDESFNAFMHGAVVPVTAPAATREGAVPAVAPYKAVQMVWHANEKGEWARGNPRTFLVEDAGQIRKLMAFFPELDQGKKSPVAAGSMAGLEMTFIRADGTTLHISTDPEMQAWSEGKGDFAVKGDLAGAMKRVAWKEAGPQPAFAEMQKLLGEAITGAAVKNFVASYQLDHTEKFDSGFFTKPPIRLVYRSNHIEAVFIDMWHQNVAEYATWPEYFGALPKGIVATDKPEDVIRRMGKPVRRNTNEDSDTLQYADPPMVLVFEGKSGRMFEIRITAQPIALKNEKYFNTTEIGEEVYDLKKQVKITEAQALGLFDGSAAHLQKDWELRLPEKPTGIMNGAGHGDFSKLAPPISAAPFAKVFLFSETSLHVRVLKPVGSELWHHYYTSLAEFSVERTAAVDKVFGVAELEKTFAVKYRGLEQGNAVAKMKEVLGEAEKTEPTQAEGYYTLVYSKGDVRVTIWNGAIQKIMLSGAAAGPATTKAAGAGDVEWEPANRLVAQIALELPKGWAVESTQGEVRPVNWSKAGRGVEVRITVPAAQAEMWKNGGGPTTFHYWMMSPGYDGTAGGGLGIEGGVAQGGPAMQWGTWRGGLVLCEAMIGPVQKVVAPALEATELAENMKAGSLQAFVSRYRVVATGSMQWVEVPNAVQHFTADMGAKGDLLWLTNSTEAKRPNGMYIWIMPAGFVAPEKMEDGWAIESLGVFGGRTVFVAGEAWKTAREEAKEAMVSAPAATGPATTRGAGPVPRFQIRLVIPPDDAVTPADSVIDPSDPTKTLRIAREILLDDSDLAGASAVPPNPYPSVKFDLTAAGGKKMAAVTASHSQESLAIFVDGTLISAPKIQGVIEEHGMITLGAMATPADAAKLAVTLQSVIASKAGPTPAAGAAPATTPAATKVRAGEGR